MSSIERILGLVQLRKRRSIATILVSQTSIEYGDHIQTVQIPVLSFFRERKSEFVEYLGIYRTSILDRQVDIDCIILHDG